MCSMVYWFRMSGGGAATGRRDDDGRGGRCHARVEHFGDAAAPLVLLTGGPTMLSWPGTLCAALARGGRHVVPNCTMRQPRRLRAVADSATGAGHWVIWPRRWPSPPTHSARRSWQRSAGSS
jgi:hypothetical protein